MRLRIWGYLWKIVTPFCKFEYREGHLELDSIHLQSSLEEVRANTGFEVRYRELKTASEPTMRELQLLRQIDPYD